MKRLCQTVVEALPAPFGRGSEQPGRSRTPRDPRTGGNTLRTGKPVATAATVPLRAVAPAHRLRPWPTAYMRASERHLPLAQSHRQRFGPTYTGRSAAHWRRWLRRRNGSYAWRRTDEPLNPATRVRGAGARAREGTAAPKQLTLDDVVRECGAERGTERRTRRARSRRRRVGGAAQPERKRAGAAVVPYRCVGCRPEQSGHQHQLSSRRPWRRMIIIAGIDTTGNSKRRTGFSFLFCGERSHPGGVRPAIRFRRGRKTACKPALGVVAWHQCMLTHRATQGRRSFCQALKKGDTGPDRGETGKGPGPLALVPAPGATVGRGV